MDNDESIPERPLYNFEKDLKILQLMARLNEVGEIPYPAPSPEGTLLIYKYKEHRISELQKEIECLKK